MLKLGRQLLAILGAAAAVTGQTTHIVGPGGFPEIDPAIQAAQPGDTILITATGRYDPFTLDRGLTIRAAIGVQPTIANALGSPTLRDTRLAVPPGQVGELERLVFAPAFALFNIGAGQVFSLRSTIVMRRCQIVGRTNGCGRGWPALDVRGGSVSLQGCRMVGRDRDGVALVARDATISAYDSVFIGGSGCWDSAAISADAVQLVNSRLHGSRVLMEGGSSPLINPNYPGGHGLVLDGRSRAWLAHAVVRGGSGGPTGGPGGDGIQNSSSTPVQTRRVTATAGTGTPNGVALRGPVTTNQDLVVAWTDAIQPTLGSSWQLHFQVQPRSLVTAIGAFRLQVTTGLSAQPLWLAATPAPLPLGSQIAGATGDATIVIPVPNTAALKGLRLWAQGGVPGGSNLELSPLLGGQIW